MIYGIIDLQLRTLAVDRLNQGAATHFSSRRDAVLGQRRDVDGVAFQLNVDLKEREEIPELSDYVIRKLATGTS